jgi:hypothetical protein
MNISCILGSHKWAGCKCSACGKIRDEGHDWSKDCEKCTKCGATRKNAHKWSDCKCSVCGKRPEKGQTWSWYLRNRDLPGGEALVAWAEGLPTAEAAKEAAEKYIRSHGGSANWKRDHPHLIVMISGPSDQSYYL